MSAESTPTARPSAYGIVRARVVGVRRLSPNFVRITLGGESLTDFGNPGATYDQRVKLIFPNAAGTLPTVPDSDDWYTAWRALPEAERGAMRTYSIRDLRVDDRGATEVDVDFVLHLVPGKTGPASSWAATATVGDELLIVGPRRGRFDGGGIEYLPGSSATVLLAGDETAAPAIARILEDAPVDLRGVAFIEVPSADDIQPIARPDGVTVHWLPRGTAEHGSALRAAVLDHLGAQAAAGETVADEAAAGTAADDLVWETPTYSQSGEQVEAASASASAGPTRGVSTRSARSTTGRGGGAERSRSTGRGDRYYWIAGESTMVTGLRRRLVKGEGIAREHVAFMGYWRVGVAMKG